jgi:hypothetical protein
MRKFYYTPAADEKEVNAFDFKSGAFLCRGSLAWVKNHLSNCGYTTDQKEVAPTPRVAVTEEEWMRRAICM